MVSRRPAPRRGSLDGDGHHGASLSRDGDYDLCVAGRETGRHSDIDLVETGETRRQAGERHLCRTPSEPALFAGGPPPLAALDSEPGLALLSAASASKRTRRAMEESIEQEVRIISWVLVKLTLPTGAGPLVEDSRRYVRRLDCSLCAS